MKNINSKPIIALDMKKTRSLLQNEKYKLFGNLFLIIPPAMAKIIRKKIKPKIILNEKPENEPGLELNQKFHVKKFPIYYNFI